MATKEAVCDLDNPLRLLGWLKAHRVRVLHKEGPTETVSRASFICIAPKGDLCFEIEAFLGPDGRLRFASGDAIRTRPLTIPTDRFVEEQTHEGFREKAKIYELAPDQLGKFRIPWLKETIVALAEEWLQMEGGKTRTAEGGGPPAPFPGFQLLLLNVDQAAAVLGVSRGTFFRLGSCGRIPLPIRLAPRVVRWRKAELEAWVAAGCPPRQKWHRYPRMVG